MSHLRAIAVAVMMSMIGLLAGCGLDQESLAAVQVTPESGTATVGATVNTVQFSALGWYAPLSSSSYAPSLGKVNQHKALPNASWRTSDSVNTGIDSKGLATCLSVTTAPATITATASGGLYGSVSGTATLICN